MAAESDVEPAELIRSSVIKELREKSVKLSPQGFSLTNLDSAPVFPYIGDNGQTTCMRKNITPSSVIYDPCAPVDPARLEKLKQHIKAFHVDLIKEKIDCYDPIYGESTPESEQKMLNAFRPLLEMLPWMLNELIPADLRKHSRKRFAFRRRSKR